MNLDSVRTDLKANVLPVHREITISQWVNEPLPAWDQVLTAHDVARLTRRPPWLRCGMALLRRSSKKRRFRGYKIGWLRSEILDWMDSGFRVDSAILVANLPVEPPQKFALPRRSGLSLERRCVG